VNHLADLETVALPEAFGRALLSAGTCEAVLVESTGAAQGDRGATGAGGGHDAGQRASAALYRVGEAYVVEVRESGERVRTVGLSPASAGAYVERVRRDDGWTTLTGAAGGVGRPRSAAGGVVD